MEKELVKAALEDRPIPEGVRICTGKEDCNGEMLFSGDMIENPDGLRMQIHFGSYQMYCPADRCFMDNIGFFVTCDLIEEAMPLGPTEEYATKIAQGGEQLDHRR